MTISEEKVVQKHLEGNLFSKDPLVSFIVLSYNNAKFLKETLNSCINQTYSNIELIISDDASVDDSQLIIEEFISCTDKKITAIFSKKNRGIVANYNRALDFCKGEYIAHIGSDDVNFPNRIEDSLKLILRNNVSMVIGSMALIDKKNYLIKYGGPNQSDQNLENILKNGIKVTSPTMLYDKEIICKYGPIPSNLANEDEELAFRAIICNGIFVSENIFVAYRKHKSSTTQYKLSPLKILKKHVENSQYVIANYESWRAHLNFLNIHSLNYNDYIHNLTLAAKRGELLYNLILKSHFKTLSYSQYKVLLIDIYWLTFICIKYYLREYRNKIFVIIRNKKVFF